MRCCLPILALTWTLSQACAADWPQWRGPNRDGISKEKGLLDSWSKEGPKLLWTAKSLGSGYASVAIVDDHIYTLGDRGKGAELIALQRKTGKELWATKVGGGEPNSTPTVDGKYVYALGRDGDLLCVEAETGNKVWSKSFSKDFGGKMMSGWGYSESILIDGDRLVCTPGAREADIVALDKTTGKTLWKSQVAIEGKRGREGAGYSSIVASKACGVKQYIQLTGRGVVSVSAEDGKPLWSYNRVANSTANIPTPIVKDDYVFCSSGYGTGAALLKVVKKGNDLDVEEMYFLEANKLQNHHGGMILIGDHVYLGHGHNEGFPLCIDLMTGLEAWRPGRGPGTGSAAIVFADGHLYFRYQNGVMALIEATPKEYRLKGSFKLASVRGPSWPHPVVAGGKMYIRDRDVLLCYDISKE
ncbi:MAG: PQQ-binding-like beta-propeller repeat protein [Gemmataceae bacterium]